MSIPHSPILLGYTRIFATDQPKHQFYCFKLSGMCRTSAGEEQSTICTTSYLSFIKIISRMRAARGGSYGASEPALKHIQILVYLSLHHVGREQKHNRTCNSIQC